MKPINTRVRGGTQASIVCPPRDYMSPTMMAQPAPLEQPTAIILRLPETGYMRLVQIIGNEKLRLAQIAGNKKKVDPPIPAIFPVAATTWWKWVRDGKAPKPVKLGPMTTAWRVEDIRALIERIAEDPIQRRGDETIVTAVEHADGLLGGVGAGEARKASAICMPTVSEPPTQTIKTRNSSYKHHLHLDRIRPSNTRSPREHHLNELERIRRENEMAEE